MESPSYRETVGSLRSVAIESIDCNSCIVHRFLIPFRSILFLLSLSLFKWKSIMIGMEQWETGRTVDIFVEGDLQPISVQIKSRTRARVWMYVDVVKSD